ncbi:transcription termination/antitermination NusG family protein, partial [candidate division KSB1 bacterium]
MELEHKWYALHVYSGQERKVVAYLESEIASSGIEDRVPMVLVPQEKI